MTREPAGLLGLNGFPEWHWWKLGNGRGGVFTPSLASGAFAISARAECMLELFPDPGIDHYRISAEICHERVIGVSPPRDRSDLPRVGLYFGHEEQEGPNSIKVHAATVVAFSDLGPNPPDPEHPPRIHLWDRLISDGPGTASSTHFPRGLATLDSVTDLPGPWRLIEIDVSPERVEVFIGGQAFAVHNKDTLQERNESLQSETNTRFRDGSVRLSGWTPRSSLGLWLFAAQIGVRNVTITPSRPIP